MWDKEAFIKRRQDKKRAERIARSKKRMAKYGDRYSCSTCFHNKSGQCTIAPMPNGCEDWFDPDVPDEQQGLNWRRVLPL